MGYSRNVIVYGATGGRMGKRSLSIYAYRCTPHWDQTYNCRYTCLHYEIYYVVPLEKLPDWLLCLQCILFRIYNLQTPALCNSHIRKCTWWFSSSCIWINGNRCIIALYTLNIYETYWYIALIGYICWNEICFCREGVVTIDGRVFALLCQSNMCYNFYRTAYDCRYSTQYSPL